MALKFRLHGLAETFIDSVSCHNCGTIGTDDEHFSTDLTKVSLDGIVVVIQCRACGEIFVPKQQRLGIINPSALREAVFKDSEETGEPLFSNFEAVRLTAEKLNTERKSDLH
ncbi:MAG: hypothetical protein KDD64_07950 [Bdellovibrionales bacterium]|nr:hypothetical protein [Bdellovibrionales bacterium]